MKKYADLIFEARHLKKIPRTGYTFLGSGRESVAEHSFLVTFISYLFAKLNSDADEKKILLMALLHDFPESRIGDINYFQKIYVENKEKKAIDDMSEGLFFKDEITGLLKEFNEGRTIESKLARDADQIAFIVDLKALKDKGAKGIDKWVESVEERLCTETGIEIAKEILSTDSDDWWAKIMLTHTEK